MAVEMDASLKERLLDTLLDGLLTDGAHHKQYALEQAVRLLTDCPVVVVEATDHRGSHYSYETLGESEEFKAFKRSSIHPDDLEHYREMGDELEEIQPWEEGIPG